MTQVATIQNAALLEQVVIGGDLSKLNAADRMQYYAAVCQSVGLNPLTKPFEYITLNSKLVLYAKRDATDQLRAIKGISIQIAGRELVGDIYIVTARATSAGREDEATGAVNIAGLKGEALANAYMKAETKAKRRVTLSIAGLGFLDETEIGDIDPEAAHGSGAPVIQMPRAIEPPPESEPRTEKPAATGGAGINKTQANLLRKQLERRAVAETALVAEYKLESLEQLPAAMFNDASDWIKAQPDGSGE